MTLSIITQEQFEELLKVYKSVGNTPLSWEYSDEWLERTQHIRSQNSQSVGLVTIYFRSTPMDKLDYYMFVHHYGEYHKAQSSPDSILTQEEYEELVQIYRSIAWPVPYQGQVNWREALQPFTEEWLRRTEAIRSRKPKSFDIASASLSLTKANNANYRMFVHLYGDSH